MGNTLKTKIYPLPSEFYYAIAGKTLSRKGGSFDSFQIRLALHRKASEHAARVHNYIYRTVTGENGTPPEVDFIRNIDIIRVIQDIFDVESKSKLNVSNLTIENMGFKTETEELYFLYAYLANYQHETLYPPVIDTLISRNVYSPMTLDEMLEYICPIT